MWNCFEKLSNFLFLHKVYTKTIILVKKKKCQAYFRYFIKMCVLFATLMGMPVQLSKNQNCYKLLCVLYYNTYTHQILTKIEPVILWSIVSWNLKKFGSYLSNKCSLGLWNSFSGRFFADNAFSEANKSIFWVITLNVFIEINWEWFKV